MNEPADAVVALVAKLPEIYQPIYGYPELSGEASRGTEDRLEDIKGVYKALSEHLGRPLRVLDLGCAQGFMSLSLASLGASVVGVEMLPENAQLCRKLAALNPAFDVSFVEGRLEEYVPSVEQGSFDLVLLLSVIHHVAFHVSTEIAELTVKRIRSCAPVLLAELALAEEPLYWASALPVDPLTIFGAVGFVRELRKSGTHLSEVKRPLYFVSEAYWYVAGAIGVIEQVKHGGHRFAKRSFAASRTYYLCDERVLKVLAISGEDADVNRNEIEREVAFLADVEDDESYPRLIGLEEDSRNVYLLREKIAGDLLADVIDAGQPIDYYLVIRDILDECIKLERRGLYHRDVRVWNVLVRDDGKFLLIDYGAISTSNHDCFWPENIYIAFLVFVKELLSAPHILVEPIREIGVTPFGFPGHLSYWVAALAKYPLASWSFELMLGELEAAFLDPGAVAIVPENAHEALLNMLEEAVTALARSQETLVSEVQLGQRAAIERVEQETARVSNLHHDLLGLQRGQHRLSESDYEHSSAIAILREGIEEQRLQGIEHSSRLGSVAEAQKELNRLAVATREDSSALQMALSVLRQGIEEQRLQGIDLSSRLGYIDKAQEALKGLAEAARGDSSSMQAALVDRLEAINVGLANLQAQASEQFAKNQVLHAELARELYEVKARVFRKGFWARLFGR